MAFVNERISDEDRSTYRLDDNDFEYPYMQRSWTIDKDKNAWLLSIWSPREPGDKEFGWLFYFDGDYYELAIKTLEYKRESNDKINILRKISSLKLIRGVKNQTAFEDNTLELLTEAFDVYKGAGIDNSEQVNNIIYMNKITLCSIILSINF